MTRKNILKTLDYASYFSLIVGAILVLVFEFTASLTVFKFALVLFGTAFLILCVLCSFKLYYLKTEAKENEELLVDKTKENKTWLIVRLVFSALFFALMVTFLCLF